MTVQKVGMIQMSGWIGVLAVAGAAFLTFAALWMLKEKKEDLFWGTAILVTILVAVAYGVLLSAISGTGHF